MTVTRQNNGSYLISDIIDDQYISQVYYFYTKREAMRAFKELTEGK